MISKFGLAATAATLLAMGTEPAAAEFKSARECVPGAKVQTRQNKTGTITGVDRSMCQVQFADGSKTSTLFWMLRAAGSSATATGKLVPGNLSLLQQRRRNTELPVYGYRDRGA